VHVLNDGTFPFPAGYFFHNVAQATWREHVRADAHGKVPVAHHCALVESERELMLIDTGYGSDTHDGRTGHVLEQLALAGYRREQVSHVVLTHAHGDHIKGCTFVEDGERHPTFPNACYHLARADWDWFGGAAQPPEFGDHLVSIQRMGLLAKFDAPLRIGAELALLPTPGHTPGHTSVLVESRGRSAIFLGDVCHHPLHFSHPGWVSSFDTHPQLTPRTRARIFELAIGLDAWVICPHAPALGIGRISRTDESFRWDPLD
jgi:glyoxylase-like metal-dependent hydrolase (beta-lactamase superfamily II)